MPFRTNVDAVAAIIEADPSVDLTPFIETANLVVNTRCLAAGYTDQLLEMIERWLAAHFYRVDKDPTLRQEKVGSGEFITEGFQAGEYLKMTRAGQQAMFLDYARTLIVPVKLGVEYLGRRHSWWYDGYGSYPGPDCEDY